MITPRGNKMQECQQVELLPCRNLHGVALLGRPTRAGYTAACTPAPKKEDTTCRSSTDCFMWSC